MGYIVLTSTQTKRIFSLFRTHSSLIPRTCGGRKFSAVLEEHYFNVLSKSIATSKHTNDFKSE